MITKWKSLKYLNNQKSIVWQWDTIVTYDTLNNLLERHTQTFDGAGRVLIQKIEQWQSNAWVNSSKNNYTYDNSGKILTILSQQWQTSTWVNYRRYTYTYIMVVEIKLPEIYEQWQSNAWVNYWRYSLLMIVTEII